MRFFDGLLEALSNLGLMVAQASPDLSTSTIAQSYLTIAQSYLTIAQSYLTIAQSYLTIST